MQRYDPCRVRIAVPSAIVASPSYSAFFCLIRRDKPAEFLAHPRRNPYICTMEKQEINTCKAIAQSKTQLGLAYAPNLEPSSAVKRLVQWISYNPDLSAALAATGYRKTQKLFTARQVALIYQYLGEP